jgi:cytochrome c oxidase subunit 4
LSEHPHPAEHPHPGPRVYLKVAGVLAVLTVLEVAVYYIEAFRPILAPVLITLSALKFSLVAAFFMHLRFDSKLFTSFFVGGLLLAGSVILALMTMFGVWGRLPPVAH